MRLIKRIRGRAARLALAGAMAIAWSGAPPYLSSRAAAQPSPSRVGAPAGAPPADTEALLGLLKRMYATAEQELRKPGADPSDVPSMAARLGHDVARVFAFVRDEVAYEPYRGVLRGARGALAARAGNAFDKALLLKAMLESGGHGARLVRAQLPPEKAKALVERFLARAPAATPPPASPADLAFLPTLAEQTGLDVADLRAVVDEDLRGSEALLAAATSAADAEAQFLRRQLESSGVKLGRTHEQWVAELAARAADHVWVEVAGGGGATTVLDPTLAAAGAGTNGAAAADGGAGAPLGSAAPVEGGSVVADLNAERHRVRFQLIYTVAEGQGSADRVLLDLPIYADEALYDSPMFMIEPADTMPPPSNILDMDRGALIKLLTGIKNYQAVLRVRGVSTGSQAFDLKGNITPITADGRVKGAQQVGAATGGLFGGGALGGGDAAAEAPNNFRELSVVMTMQTPGEVPVAQRRVLLTKAQATGEEFLSPLLEWRMLLQPQALTADLVGFEALEATAGAVGALLPAMQAPAADAGEAANRAARVKPSTFPALLVNLSGLRESATAAALKQDPSLVVLWDRPQLSIAEQRVCANAKQGRACGHATIDLVDNALSFVPRTPAAAGAAAAAALRQGVFDTVAEAAVLARQSGADPAAGGVGGAIDSLRAAREAGAGLVVAGPADAGALAATSLSTEDRQWVAQFEPATRRVAAPAKVARGGGSVWWSIDPQTGEVLGRREGGRGQATVEDVLTQLAVGVGCLVVNAINTNGDMKATKRHNMGAAYYLAQLGCLVGAGFGVGGVVIKGAANSSALINMVIGGIISVLAANSARG